MAAEPKTAMVKYPFSWLDEIIEFTLNPEKTNIRLITPSQLETINGYLPVEMRKIRTSMKEQAFSLYQTEQVKILAGNYYFSIQCLRRRAEENLAGYPLTGMFRQTGEQIIVYLIELEGLIRERYDNDLSNLTAGAADYSIKETAGTVKLGISVDQIGILLRAAFDVHLVLGSSFRKACKVIAPAIATEHKQAISWDSMRSNAGRPENRDMEIAIALLEKMIGKIKDYKR